MKFASVLHTLATGLAGATSADQICTMTLDAVQHALAVERASVLLKFRRSNQSGPEV